MTGGYQRFDSLLLKAIRVTTGILLAVMFVIIISEVAFRYVLTRSVFWTEELARYVMFYMVLIGSSAGVRQNRHPSLSFVIQKFPAGFQRKWSVLIDGLVLLVLVVIFWEGAFMAVDEWPGKTAALRISFFWVYLALPIGAFLMMVQIVAEYFFAGGAADQNDNDIAPSKED
ncbi:MAG TPA: TRAP transporter small permease [Sedimentisphaerales bacterium]|nr:TRAP transporter small permease [Sedimentisphaerales bacterium]